MIKHSFQEFFPIISRFFFLVACYIQTSKTQNQRQSFIFQLKKKKFQRISFFFSFIFWGGCYIQTSKGTFMCLCINRHKLVVSISTEFYLRTLWFHDHIKHQQAKKTKYNNTSALNTLYACCSCYYKDIYSFILLII